MTSFVASSARSSMHSRAWSTSSRKSVCYRLRTGTVRSIDLSPVVNDNDHHYRLRTEHLHRSIDALSSDGDQPLLKTDAIWSAWRPELTVQRDHQLRSRRNSSETTNCSIAFCIDHFATAGQR